MLVPLIIGTALMMQFLDSSAVVTALPAIARSLHAAPSELSLLVSAYTLSLSVLIPAASWIADRFGTRIVFQIALGVFALASALCGVSDTVLQITSARILQGAGAALMIPVARLILLRTFSKTELLRATSWYSIPGVVGPVFAPLMGGLLVDYASWRWIFFINVPIAITAIVLVGFTIDNYRVRETAPFDWLGFGLIGTVLIELSLTAEGVAHGAINLATGLFAVVATAITIALTVRHMRRHPHAILDLSLFRIATFRFSNTSGMLCRIAFNGALILQPMLLQFGFGMDATQSGLLTLFGAAGLLLMQPWVRTVLRRFGFRTALWWNSVIGAIATLAICTFTAQTPWIVIAVILAVGGMTRCLQYTSLSTIVFADIAPNRINVATTYSTMSDRFSSALGASLASVFLRIAASLQGEDATYLDVANIQWSLGAFSLFIFVSGLGALALRHDAGTEVSGHSADTRRGSA